MIRRLVAGTVAVNLFVLFLAGLSLHQSRLQYQERAEITTQNLSQVLEENIDGIVDKVDMALLSAQDEVKRQFARGGLDARALNEFLAQQQSHQPEIMSFRATDAEGVVRYGHGVPAAGGPKNTDREYFIRARDEVQPGLIITKPVFTRIDKKWAVVLARRLSRPDGSFAGVAYVNVALEHLTRTFAALNIGTYGSVSLRDRELRLVARYPEPLDLQRAIGSMPSVEFQQYLRTWKDRGTLRSRTPLDNIERIVSYRRIHDKPFYIVVGAADEDYLAVWWREAVRMGAVALFFVFTTVFFAWLIYRSWRRQRVALGALRVSEEKHKALIETTNTGYVILDAQGRVLDANSEYLRQSGHRSLEDILGRNVTEWTAEYDRERNAREVEACLDRGYVRGLEVDYAGEEGRVVPVEINATVLKSGNSLQIISLCLDISHRRQAEEALRASEYRLNQLFENMSSGVAMYRPSPDGQDFFFIALNRAAERIENVRREDVIGKSLVKAFPGVQEFGVLDVLRRVWKTGTAEHFPLSFYRDGRVSGWRENFVYKLPSGEVVAIYDDVTQRKQAELALKHLNETLEERVRLEVAKNTAHERLLIQQSRLAAMGEMIGNIAHQWRQPLNAMALLLAEIQDAYAYNELTRESLDKIVADGQHMIQKMSSTIDDFRDFFKPNKEKECFSLGKAVADAVSLIRPSLTGHDIAVQVEEGGEALVNGYPNELSQVFLNLFANAKEALLERKVENRRIIVSWDRDDEKAWVTVRDNGGGIPPDTLPKIFDPYFTTKEKGTGIGLYMSKTIMEHMNGRIEVRNIEGGAEFNVICPLWKA